MIPFGKVFNGIRSVFGGCHCKNEVLVADVCQVLCQYQSLLENFIDLPIELKIDLQLALNVADKNDNKSIVENSLRRWVLERDQEAKIKVLKQVLKKKYSEVVRELDNRMFKDHCRVVVKHEHKKGCERIVEECGLLSNSDKQGPTKDDQMANLCGLFSTKGKIYGFSNQNTFVIQNLQDFGPDQDMQNVMTFISKLKCPGQVETVRRVKDKREGRAQGLKPLAVQLKSKRNRIPIKASNIVKQFKNFKKFKSNQVTVEEFNENDFSDDADADDSEDEHEESVPMETECQAYCYQSKTSQRKLRSGSQTYEVETNRGMVQDPSFLTFPY